MEAALRQELERFIVVHRGAVHFVVEHGVSHGSQIELELGEPQGQISLAVTLVEHGLLGVNGPPFDIDA